MFVKICATTSVADARAAVDAGADAVGVIFAVSRRHVTPAEARVIVDSFRGEALAVGVFRDHTLGEVTDIVDEVGLDAVQIHGRETPELSRAIRDHVGCTIRAMAAGDEMLTGIDDHGADAVHLDTPTPGGGVPFDWSLVGDLGSRHRLILAGGLRPDTVAGAIATVRPWGVDVASGVEASYGVKDHDAVRAFVATAKAAGADLPATHPDLPRPAPRA